MRLFTIFFSIIAISQGSCHFKDASLCEKYRNGTFIYSPKGSSRNLVLERADSIQIEKDLTTGRSSKYKISWSGCNYSMVLLEANFELHENMKPEDYRFKYEIIKQTDEYYVFKEISGMFENSIESDTIWLKRR